MAAQAEALCRAAADVLRRSNKGEGVRQVLYSVRLPASAKPQLQAIVLGAQKDEALIWEVAKKSGLMDKMPATHVMPDDRLLLVVLYEALLGSRRVRGNADIFTFVKDNKAELQRCLAELRKQGTVEKYKEKIRLPRYARVNTLKTTMKTALAHFQGRGWKVDTGKGDVDASSGGSIVCPPKGTLMADPILEDVIAFPAGTSLHADPLVSSGAVILQDRSSCLSAIALAPLPASSKVADACAAPGNKTSHLAMLHKRARAAEGGDEEQDGGAAVLAFERDKPREKMLRSQMTKLGCGSEVCVHGRDFTEAVREAREGEGPEDGGPLWGVTHVLCDPSCSGSGLVAQYHGQKTGVITGEEEGMAENEAGRGAGKEELAEFAAEQTKIVSAALSLPHVEAVVYSTCSVHKEENEEVVAAVLRQCQGRARQVRVLPLWPHRGLATEGCDGEQCARASHEKDSTNGFFVAKFEVVKGGQQKKQKRSGEEAGSGEAARKRSRYDAEGGAARVGKKAKSVILKAGADKAGSPAGQKGEEPRNVKGNGHLAAAQRKATAPDSNGVHKGKGGTPLEDKAKKFDKKFDKKLDKKFDKKGKKFGKGAGGGDQGAEKPTKGAAWKGAIDVD